MRIFQKRQWNKPLLRCSSCISHLNATKDGKTAQRDHSISNGLVDGKKHDVPNKKRCDRAMRCSPDDQVKAKQGLNDFLAYIQLESKSVQEIADLVFIGSH
jgi:hypothetical protein